MLALTTQELARRARVSCLRAVHLGQTSHVGSSLSVTDILAVLYGEVANVSPDNLEAPDRDIIIVSKGHAAAGVYSVMANAGIIPLEWLEQYCSNGTPLGGHVTSHGVPGVELSTGSLGHGLPVGLGIALAAKRGSVRRHVFVVMSDGECDEGSIWESALFAAHHHLDNVTVAIDRNRLQSLTTTEETMGLEPFADKWRAFGWEASDVDGHDHRALAEALTPGDSSETAGKPRVVICNTVKGKGVSFMENKVLWHYRSPSDDDLVRALAELGEQ